MNIKDVIMVIEQQGYQRVPTNVPEIMLYRKDTGSGAEHLFFVDTTAQPGLSPYAIRGMITQLRYKLVQADASNEMLSIIYTDQVEKYKVLSEEDEEVWYLDTKAERLIIYENQKQEFDQIRMEIEKSLANGDDQSRMRRIKQLPISSASLVGVNLLVFLFVNCGLFGWDVDKILSVYGCQWIKIVKGHEFYRLITSMFLHLNLEHLVNNMIVLFFIGMTLEKVVSRRKVMAVYFGSGIIAGMVSVAYKMIHNNSALSVGASGAIFGLVGAMLILVVKCRGRIQGITISQMVLFVVSSLYAGFTAGNTDNAGHIGGFLSGILIGLLIHYRTKREKRED